MLIHNIHLNMNQGVLCIYKKKTKTKHGTDMAYNNVVS